jgi:ethanolamine ammonia-lyase small subunit
MTDELVKAEPWRSLSQWTSARIAMGRVGASLPTTAVLEFNLDHAQVRDAIHTPLDTDRMQQEFQQAGFKTLVARSRARDRSEYLRRPDLGRLLDASCIAGLTRDTAAPTGTLTVVVADGLSSLAPASHALAMLQRLHDGLVDWQLDDVVIASEARVALADEIGQLRGAEASLILIGERPGLKSPDSMGAYLTYRPRAGRMDSERNCVSNIRPEGLAYDVAVFRLLHLLARVRAMGETGVALKDDSEDSNTLDVAQARHRLSHKGIK